MLDRIYFCPHHPQAGIAGEVAAHASLRTMLDLAVFVAVPPDVQERFTAFYRWKGLDQQPIDALWRARAENEWPAVDAQQARADLVLAPGAHLP